MLGNDGTVQLNEDERKNEVAEKLKSRSISLSYDSNIIFTTKLKFK
jgi:hypothetical protein